MQQNEETFTFMSKNSILNDIINGMDRRSGVVSDLQSTLFNTLIHFSQTAYCMVCNELSLVKSLANFSHPTKKPVYRC